MEDALKQKTALSGAQVNPAGDGLWTWTASVHPWFSVCWLADRANSLKESLSAYTHFLWTLENSGSGLLFLWRTLTNTLTKEKILDKYVSPGPSSPVSFQHLIAWPQMPLKAIVHQTNGYISGEVSLVCIVQLQQHGYFPDCSPWGKKGGQPDLDNSFLEKIESQDISELSQGVLSQDDGQCWDLTDRWSECQTRAPSYKLARKKPKVQSWGQWEGC